MLKDCQGADMISVFWKSPASQTSKLTPQTSLFFSEIGPHQQKQALTVKGYSYPKYQIFTASETCQHIKYKSKSHSLQGYIPSSTRKCCFYTMYIYGEEVREKIPIKSLPQELQKSGLKPSVSSVYIFYLCNVTSEKEHRFFINKT